jgi:hypothetical protein
MNKLLSFENNQQFLLNFGALSPRFFSGRQVPEIIRNESSKNTENALIEWLRKATTRYYSEIKV